MIPIHYFIYNYYIINIIFPISPSYNTWNFSSLRLTFLFSKLNKKGVIRTFGITFKFYKNRNSIDEEYVDDSE